VKMSSQRFFVMAKPDAVRRGLTGEIVRRFEKRGFVLEHIHIFDPQAWRGVIEDHYAEHKGKSFYDALIKFTLSGRICAMVWSGNIQVARSLIGSTLPWDAQPGTIRGDYASSLPENLVHCSDNPENAKREVDLWQPLF
jgi:nucleoside-diphosphate kinase